MKQAFILIFWLTSFCTLPLNSQQMPNMVFFLADDCTKYDIACYGSKDAITPTIDKLATQGMKFNRCYQAAPMCSPTRHNLYTGMYPVRTGAYPNHTFVNEGVKSVVQYLKPLGYRVALAGKRHILPDEIFAFEYLDGSHIKETNPEFDKVDAFIKEATTNKQPFCLFVCSTEPHTPWSRGDQSLYDKDKITLPPTFPDLPKIRELFRNYLAEINFMDGQLDTLLQLLNKHKISDNTVVMYASEQGNNFPFAKWTCYNAGLTSALIVRWPGKIKAGTVSNALVEYSDVLPTIIELAGGKPVDGLDGESLLPILKQEKKEHKQYTYGIQTTRGIYFGADYFGIRSISNGTYRLILNLSPDVEFKNSVSSGKGFNKYFTEFEKSGNLELVNFTQRYKSRPPIELYNDNEDPYNLNNLAGKEEYKDIQRDLNMELLKWMAYCGDEGIKTELLALEHMRKRTINDSVVVITEPQKALPQGNIKAPTKGYYTFFIEGDGEVFVDGIYLTTGTTKKRRGAPYGIIGLEKGYHQIDIKNTSEMPPKITWSGPGMKSNGIEL